MKTILVILLTINLGFSQEYGIASHYSIRTNGGTHTASGIPLRDDSYTFAHKTLPFGTIARITNLSNGKSVMVKVTDDGPHIKDRIADLSQASAKKLGFLEKGLTRVRLEVITLGKGKFR